ncbi:MAG: carboxylase [Rhodospirillaceae bacterium]|nr:carboxylase [Rhodospirillaceae bacterium]|tara:strand:- start:130 stop:1782 length:1653 start_codon:yes stop_codon:yes gene_type:complete
MSNSKQSYPDLHDHIRSLDDAGLLVTVDDPVDKDSEMHALVRWQFVGGLKETERKAFLFRNIKNAQGRSYSLPIVVGALAASQDIYSIGMGVPVDEIGAKWENAIANPISPKKINSPACQEIVIEGKDLHGAGNGIDALPIPVSTPGFDNAPTLTSTNVITRDPENGTQNMGTYRAALKASDRLVVRMATRVGGAGGYQHYKKYQERGDKEMPVAIVVGCPPCVAFMGPQKLPMDMDEMAVAGGLAGVPVNMANAYSVDLLVPAEAELVIEGFVDTEIVEPEGPFGESHGHVALEEFNMPMRVTAITRRHDAVLTSYISQAAPSESSVIKRVAYEPLFLTHLRDALGIKGVKKVSLHEPLTGLLRVTIITVQSNTPSTEIWRALYGAAYFKGDCSKICIAVNDDIDPDNSDAMFWAMAYRMNPVNDVQTLAHRGQGHGPKREHTGEEDSTLLMDATMKSFMPPVALPTREYMEKGLVLWNKLNLPPVRPTPPWFGYSLGDWNSVWEAGAKRAAEGGYLENGRLSQQRQQQSLPPETSVREVEEGWEGVDD